jgi:hypothetical protein
MERKTESQWLTMNVEARAMSLPQVSAIISKVRALVEVSMPLFTNIIKGTLVGSSKGCSFVRVSLYARVRSWYDIIGDIQRPHTLCRYSEKDNMSVG